MSLDILRIYNVLSALRLPSTAFIAMRYIRQSICRTLDLPFISAAMMVDHAPQYVLAARRIMEPFRLDHDATESYGPKCI